MTTATTEEMQVIKQTLAMKRAIDRRLNELVRRATELVSSTGIADKASEMEKSQFGNVLAVATETGSVEVVKNFIRYQIGRKNGLGWRHGSFGLRLIAEIDGWLAQQAKAIAETHTQEQIQLDVAWMELVRLYIGYLRRDWSYQRWQKSGEAV